MDEAVEIFNFGDFERPFGGLRADSEAVYAIQQFFRNGGNRAWVVRTAATIAEAAASVTLQDAAGAAINGASSLVTASEPPGAPGTRPAQTGTTGGQITSLSAQTDDTANILLGGGPDASTRRR